MGQNEGVRLEPLYSDPANESRKRRREIVAIVLLGGIFLVATGVAFRLFGFSRSLPFVHSIFFFGLVNFNIILFLLLLFLIFRNIAKVFSERQRGFGGSSLKGKLIAAFVGFTFVPTTLMFLVSVFYINNSFDKWFSEKMAGVLKSSLEVTNAYYVTAKKRNYHFAHVIARDLERETSANLAARLNHWRSHFRLDALEYYPSLFGAPTLSVTKDDAIASIPSVSLEFRQKGISELAEASTIHHFSDGNLVRVIVPARYRDRQGAIVVSSFVPLSLVSRMDDIASAYEELRDTNPLAYPLKSIYLIILVLMTLVILLCATWFGFYLARQLSIPLELLGQAARRVAKGDYAPVVAVSGSPEISQLVSDFNKMTSDLENSEREIRSANTNLHQTLDRLDEHTKYIEVVLSNVSTGVVSVDNSGTITMINRHAAEILGIEAETFLGRSARDILNDEQYRLFEELVQSLRDHRASSIQKEISVQIGERQVPLQMTLSLLTDTSSQELGKVLVFQDLTPVVSAQRAAAWTEVARRIAHEIKNPLTPISLAAQRLQKKFGGQIRDPAFEECTTMIINQVDDIKLLVNEFSQFARLPKSQPIMADLGPVLESSVVLYRQAHKAIEFSLDLDQTTPQFMFDPDQMKRVMNNLIDNAVSALEGCTDPRVELLTRYDEHLKIVRITVADNGRGIPRNLRDRLFEPYVTTKRNGTGLGLAIVKRTVEDHSGFVRAFRRENGGTGIVIELPVIVANTSSKIVLPRDMEQGTLA